MKQFAAVMRDADGMTVTTCVIFGNTVTTTCLGMGAPGVPGGQNCMLNMATAFHAYTPAAPLSFQELLRFGLLHFFYTILLRIKDNLFRRPTPSWRLGAGKCGKMW
ncbi:hypothetical protein KIN20_014266 [Parelaphostrongylus tenuis]|uniref:Uncharacterized protein n=1 Tax=Parelaphostrongylus tenuis TaxID=148309 RepID=A0AAD5MDD5_PARTN|nr:hypothetical protein KIN20_014266 [Parelaphostrongylus tenuis]